MSVRILKAVMGLGGPGLVLALGWVVLPSRGLAQAGDPTALLNLQDAYIRAESAGQWDEAVRLHKLRAIVTPMEADIWVRISDIEIRKGDTNAALEALTQAVSVSPSNAVLHARLSQGYAVADRPKEALAAMERAVVLAPTNTDYLLARAQLANWIGKPAVAADSYERVLRLRPDDPTALWLLARARMGQGDLDESAGAYRKYLRAHPDQAEAYLEYAKLEAWRGNFAHSIEILDQYGKKFGNQPMVDREQARIYALADKPDAAMALNQPLLRAAPTDFELQFTRAAALHYDRQPRAAAETVDTLAQLRPDSVEVKGIRDFVETPQRPDIQVGGRYYFDNDKLRIKHGEISAGVPIKPESRVIASVEENYLHAPEGSGLESVDGSENVEHRKAWIGVRQIVVPALWGEARVGFAEVLDDVDQDLVYAAKIGGRPWDALRLTGTLDHDYLLISPRSASMPVERTSSQLTAQWEPDLRYTVVGTARYDDMSDDNTFLEGVLAPRRAVLRSEDFNVDLGARGIWSGYDKDLDSGYYDPERYRQYALTAFGYWKLSAECGWGLIGSAGYYKDNTMSDYDFGWAGDTELTFGAFSDWMLKLSGHVLQNLRQGTGDFHAYATSASLTRRF